MIYIDIIIKALTLY